MNKKRHRLYLPLSRWGMPSPRGYCVRRYPFERGGFPATPLAVRPAPARSIFDPAHPVTFIGASVIAASLPQASPLTAPAALTHAHETSPSANGPSVIDSCVVRMADQPIAPASLGRVTDAGFRASSPPAFPRGLALSPPPATRDDGCGKKNFG